MLIAEPRAVRAARIDDPQRVEMQHRARIPLFRDPQPAAQGAEARPGQLGPQVVALRFEGNTFEEIAEQLDIDEKTARRVIRRLRETSQLPGDKPRSE
jgi:Fic family protein